MTTTERIAIRQVALAPLPSIPQPAQREWSSEPLPAAIDYVIRAFHRPLRNRLSEMQGLGATVARLHGARRPSLLTPVALVDELTAELLAHMLKEEMLVFPAIREMASGQLAPVWLRTPVETMTAEHDRIADLLDRLRQATDRYVAPAGSSVLLRIFYQGLQMLDQSIHVQLNFENTVLFSRAVSTPAEFAK